MHKKTVSLLVILLLAVGALVFYFGQPQANVSSNPAATTSETTGGQSSTVAYQNLSAKELNDWINSGKDILLIDVREPSEFKEGYLLGAVNTPLGQLDGRLQEIPKDKDVVVYCRSGRRSAEAAGILVKNGYQRVFNLEGGIINWPYEVIIQQARLDNLNAA